MIQGLSTSDVMGDYVGDLVAGRELRTLVAQPVACFLNSQSTAVEPGLALLVGCQAADAALGRDQRLLWGCGGSMHLVHA